MKKSFLLLLISIMTVFLIAGCADDTTKGDGGNGETPSGTPLTPEMLEQLKGTYKVTFFGSQVTNVRDIQNEFTANMANAFYISNDCTKAKELYPEVIGANSKNNCTPSGQSTLLEGTVLITVSATDMNITSRMQMEGGSVDLSPTDKYQYTKYNPTNRTAGKGVEGWNYDVANNSASTTSTKFSESPFTVTLNEDGTVRIDMTLVGKVVTDIATVDAKNTIILEKLNTNTTELENKPQKTFTSKES